MLATVHDSRGLCKDASGFEGDCVLKLHHGVAHPYSAKHRPTMLQRSYVFAVLAAARSCGAGSTTQRENSRDGKGRAGESPADSTTSTSVFLFHPAVLQLTPCFGCAVLWCPRNTFPLGLFPCFSCFLCLPLVCSVSVLHVICLVAQVVQLVKEHTH